MRTPDLLKITKAEQRLDALLPHRRLKHAPSSELLAAATLWSQAVWEEAEQLGPIPLTGGQLTHGLHLAGNPVFVCGVHRSGTTLVRNLLDGHPDLAVLPSEGTYYTNLEQKLKLLPANEWIAFLGTEWLRRLANPINQPPYWLLGRSTGEGSPYVDFARYLFAWWEVLPHKGHTQWPHTAVLLAYASCFNSTAEFWVDKTPANERFLNRIWDEMPNAKIVLPIRHPIAVLISRKKMEPGLNLRRALLDLKVSFRTAVKQLELNDPRFFIVRYEELTEHPKLAIQKLAAFLNIGVSDILSQPTVAGIPAGANSSFNHDAAPGQILKLTDHQQNGELSKAELQLLSACLDELSNQLNYPLPKVGLLNKAYLKLKYRLWQR